MEIEQMIKQLIDSKIIENEEFALTLLRSDELSIEQKREAINKYINDLIKGDKGILSEEHKNVFKMVMKLYNTMQDMEVKNRVKKI